MAAADGVVGSEEEEDIVIEEEVEVERDDTWGSINASTKEKVSTTTRVIKSERVYCNVFIVVLLLRRKKDLLGKTRTMM